MVTTIQVPEELRDRIKALKQPGETYADVIEAGITWLEEEDEMALSKETLEALAESEADLAAGRVHSLEQVKKDLGL